MPWKPAGLCGDCAVGREGDLLCDDETVSPEPVSTSGAWQLLPPASMTIENQLETLCFCHNIRSGVNTALSHQSRWWGGVLPSVWSPPPFWPESPVQPPVWPRRWHNHRTPTARSSLSGRRRWWLTSDCCDLVKRDTLFFKTNALARFLSIIRRVTALPIPIIIHRIIACRIGPNHLFV